MYIRTNRSLLRMYSSKWNDICIKTGIGTLLSSVTAIGLMSKTNTVLELWTGGITAMFIGRFIAAGLGVLNVNGLLKLKFIKTM